MGTVHLTSSHRNLLEDDQATNDWRPLIDSYLEAPILNAQHRPIAVRQQRFTVAALRGLMSLHNVSAVVSYHLLPGKSPQLQVPERIWGDLYIDGYGEAVVQLPSSYRRDNIRIGVNENRDHLWRWLEGQPGPNRAAGGEREQFYEFWSDPNRWEQYFKQQLVQAAGELQTQAGDLRQKAVVLEVAAGKIGRLVK